MLAFFTLPSAWANANTVQPNIPNPATLAQCLEIALQQSAAIEEANALIELYRAKLSVVQANYYPKLSILSYLAPMFTVRGDINSVERDFDLGSWGPSTHLEALLAMPIYTFGRLEAGETAANERLSVEKARLREAENHVKLEVKKFYYTYLYAKTILPHLEKAAVFVKDTYIEAKRLYDEASGKVTKVDLMKLKYGEAEVKKYILQAQEGVKLALSALKHTMGLADDISLNLADVKIPPPSKSLTIDTEANLLEIAINNRPEWDQIRHGTKAATAFRESEKLTNRPIVFLAGSLQANWSPTRDDATNPYQYDPYNDIFGGFAIGIKYDLDWALTKAKVQAANATLQQVNALKQLAITGIPLQIKKAHSDTLRFKQQIKLSKQARRSASKWVAFAGAAYSSGTGEVKDVLEGMVAMLTAKRDYYQSILDFHIAHAELHYAIGL